MVSKYLTAERSELTPVVSTGVKLSPSQSLSLQQILYMPSPRFGLLPIAGEYINSTWLIPLWSSPEINAPRVVMIPIILLLLHLSRVRRNSAEEQTKFSS